jgi:hypothetical protein
MKQEEITMYLNGWIKTKLNERLSGSDWRICGSGESKESYYLYITCRDDDPETFEVSDYKTIKLRYSYHDPIAFRSMCGVNVTISYYPSSGYAIEIPFDEYEELNLDTEKYIVELDDDDDPCNATLTTNNDERMAEIIVALWMNDKTTREI